MCAVHELTQVARVDWTSSSAPMAAGASLLPGSVTGITTVVTEVTRSTVVSVNKTIASCYKAYIFSHFTHLSLFLFLSLSPCVTVSDSLVVCSEFKDMFHPLKSHSAVIKGRINIVSKEF